MATVSQAECCINDSQYQPSSARQTVADVIDKVAEKRGIKRTFQELISDEAWDKRMAEIRVPDWQCLLLKLDGKIPDGSWQSLINVTQLGRKEVNDDLVREKIVLCVCFDVHGAINRYSNFNNVTFLNSFKLIVFLMH